MKAKRRWGKVPPALIDLFDASLPDDGRVERRSMFGCPCAFANGNMFCGLHEDRLIVRLRADDRAELLRQPGARPFEPMPGRQMKEYVVIPTPLTNRDVPVWIAAAFRYAASLPAKPRRTRAVTGKKPRR